MTVCRDSVWIVFGDSVWSVEIAFGDSVWTVFGYSEVAEHDISIQPFAPKTKLNIGQHAFSVFVLSIWIQLPIIIKFYLKPPFVKKNQDIFV